LNKNRIEGGAETKPAFMDENLGLPERLAHLQAVSDPTMEELISCVLLLFNPSENEILQAAVLPVLKRAGLRASILLYGKYLSSSGLDVSSVIRISYALSQIIESPDIYFLEFFKSDIPRVRQNGVIGLAQKNDPDFSSAFQIILQNDSDPETAFEAAVSLEKLGPQSLKYLEEVLKSDIKANPQNNANTRPLDDHVISKVLEVSGEFGNENTIPYIIPYFSHPDGRVSNSAKEAVLKIKSRV